MLTELQGFERWHSIPLEAIKIPQLFHGVQEIYWFYVL